MRVCVFPQKKLIDRFFPLQTRRTIRPNQVLQLLQAIQGRQELRQDQVRQGILNWISHIWKNIFETIRGPWLPSEHLRFPHLMAKNQKKKFVRRTKRMKNCLKKLTYILFMFLIPIFAPKQGKSWFFLLYVRFTTPPPLFFKKLLINQD